MPQADRMQPWTVQELKKVLKFLDENFDLWHKNHLKACERAIKTLYIDRDAKSVYNKVHNMIKSMDDKNKRKPNVFFNSRNIMNSLKSIRSKSEEKGTTRVENTDQMNTDVVSRISSLNITDTTGTEMADNITEIVKNNNQKLKELKDGINKGRSELEERERKVSQHRSKIESMKEELKKMEEEVSQQKTEIQNMEKEKEKLDKFFRDLVA